MEWIAQHWFEVSVVILLAFIAATLVLLRRDNASYWNSHAPNLANKIVCANEDPLYRITASVERVEELVGDIERELSAPGAINGTGMAQGADQGPTLSIVPTAPPPH